MRSVELNYFVFTISSMIVIAFVIIWSNYRLRAKEASNPFSHCSIDDAIRVTEYEAVNDNETDAENRFEINGEQYGCPCSRDRCIRKCCPWGQYLGDKSCKTSQNGLEQLQKELFSELKFYKSIIDKKPNTHGNRHFNVVFKLPNGCPENETKRNIQWLGIEKEYLLENGNLFIPAGETSLHQFDYCFDTRKQGDNVTINYFLCEPEEIMNNTDLSLHWYTIKGYANLISGAFLILTFLIYAVLPKLQNLNGKCLMSYFLSMIVSDLTLSANLLVRDKNVSFCEFLGKFFNIYTQ